jgi:hypothetical protein
MRQSIERLFDFDPSFGYFSFSSSFPMSVNAKDLFPCANVLFLRGFKKKNCINELCDLKSSLSSLISWSSLRKISVDENNVISASRLELLLKMASNVDTLEIVDDSGILLRSILRNIDHLGTRVNEQVRNFTLKSNLLNSRLIEEVCVAVR